MNVTTKARMEVFPADVDRPTKATLEMMVEQLRRQVKDLTEQNEKLRKALTRTPRQ